MILIIRKLNLNEHSVLDITAKVTTKGLTNTLCLVVLSAREHHDYSKDNTY